MKKDETERGAAATDPDVDCDGKPLPEWTKRYPAEERAFLALWGEPPDSYPRAHEVNLRLIEVGQAFDRVANGPDPEQRIHGRLLREIFPPTVGGTIWHVKPDRPSMEELLQWAKKGELPPLPEARPPEEIEVRPDWLEMYPPEYRPFLARWGVPTIAGTEVDAFNKCLIELVTPDCADNAELQLAANTALMCVFGDNFDDGHYDLDDLYEDHDLENVCWAAYPQEHRQFISLLGRPDYEHPAAASFNRALIAGVRFLRAEGMGHDSAIQRLRRHLWAEFFGDDPVAGKD